MNQRLFPYYEHFEPYWNPLYHKDFMVTLYVKYLQRSHFNLEVIDFSVDRFQRQFSIDYQKPEQPNETFYGSHFLWIMNAQWAVIYYLV